MSEVHRRCMARTNIDLDDRLVAEVMRRYDLGTKKDAVNFARPEPPAVSPGA